jgi:methionyl-tRNA formyltransferase
MNRRGAAPIHRAIEAGDAETGVVIMQMDQGLDTGDMLLTGRLPIGPADTTALLHDHLADLGADLVLQALDLAAQGLLAPVPQPAEGVTYAHKIEKAEATIDWSLPAEVIARRVRAFDPVPGASSAMGTEVVKIWRAQALDAQASDAPPGQVMAADGEGVRIACGQGQLLVTELQRAGAKRLPAADFLRGFALVPGQRLGTAG